MNVSEIEKLAKELQEYTRVVGSHNKHIQSVANRLFELVSQPQLNENQKIKTNNKLLKINDLAFELQHDDKLTKEQWDKVEQIYKLSLPMQLNESQQIVLDWLKACAERFTFSVMYPIFHLGDYDRRVLEGPRQIDRAFSELNFRQEAQVLQAYSQWCLEQEE